MTLCFGLLNISTPSFALELDRGQFTSNAIPVPAVLNAPGILLVPVNPSSLPESKPEVTAPASAEDATDEETPSYATLSDAVAAQDTGVTSEDLHCLAGAVYFESKGEPLAGQLAVANVIINRTKSGRFPRSICSVVTQRGQFSFVRGGRIPSIAANRAYRTAAAVARVAIDAAWENPTPNALFFHARYVAPRWAKVQVASIGNHIFYR